MRGQATLRGFDFSRIPGTLLTPLFAGGTPVRLNPVAALAPVLIFPFAADPFGAVSTFGFTAAAAFLAGTDGTEFLTGTPGTAAVLARTVSTFTFTTDPRAAIGRAQKKSEQKRIPDFTTTN